MRSREEVVAYEVTVDEKQNKVLVSVELQARRGRETTHRVGAADVRQYLEGQGINAAELIPSASSSCDRQTIFVFLVFVVTMLKNHDSLI